MNDELEAMNEMMQSTSSGANNFSSGGSNDFVNRVTGTDHFLQFIKLSTGKSKAQLHHLEVNSFLN